MGEEPQNWTAFSGPKRLISGPPERVIEAVRKADAPDSVLIFNDADGRRVEIHPQGDAPTPQRGRGRPKLGVVGREVTLLPRHWDWLARQPGGASVALRRLVDEARKARAGADRRRTAQDATYRAMLVLAGDSPGYEEALRALYAGEGVAFRKRITTWPKDVRGYLGRLATPAFEA